MNLEEMKEKIKKVYVKDGEGLADVYDKRDWLIGIVEEVQKVGDRLMLLDYCETEEEVMIVWGFLEYIRGREDGLGESSKESGGCGSGCSNQSCKNDNDEIMFR